MGFIIIYFSKKMQMQFHVVKTLFSLPMSAFSSVVLMNHISCLNMFFFMLQLEGFNK